MKPSKKDFIAEAEEIIEELGSLVLELQEEFSPETLNSVFRSVHTMKGLSGLFGIKEVTDLSHSLESLLDDLRLGKIEITGEIIDFILSNIDILKNLIDQVAEDHDIDDVSNDVREIEKFRGVAGAKEKESSLSTTGISESILKVLSEYEEHRLKANLGDGHGIYLLKTVFSLSDFAPQLEELIKRLKDTGELIATLPTSQGVPDGSIGFNLLLGASYPLENIKSRTLLSDVEQLISPKLSQAVTPESKTSKAKETSLKSAATTVRVNIDKLDGILNTINELMLLRSALVRISQELTESYGYAPLAVDLYKISQSIDVKLRHLQHSVLDLRMVPFSHIFKKLAQVVRRYTREAGKEINLNIFGEDTEIDKQIAEEIIDPLVHLVRNSIDHGIESKNERTALGKDPQGNLTLKAFSRGNSVVIEIQDDGAGIDPDKVLQKAVEKKIISKEQVLDRNEIINLIFAPGLSTKDGVSEISGRGVGMDIVKEKITSLGGFVGIETEKGAGSKFILTLPITLAIVKALITEVSKRRFAVPLTSIEETFIFTKESVQTIEGREVIELRNEMLPLLRTSEAFDLEEDVRDEYYGVVVGVGQKRVGLVMDELIEQTEIVIKPLGEHLKNIPCISGAAETGKYEIVFVMDIDAMMDEAFSKRKNNGSKGKKDV
ncbi:MAG: chemotaxis protein CheA [Nitrospirae bacterium]|nr:chemotaxis protein CheA [Nitrospirota bacterium]